MKPLSTYAFAFSSFVCLALFTGCDWESGSSEGFSAQIEQNNIAGVYDGRFPGGRAVQNTSNGNIVRMSIQQSGSSVTVRDNQGSTYTGFISAPRLQFEDFADSFSSQFVISAWQITFSGRDEVAARDIEFVGTITLGTITDVQGTTRTRTNTNSNNTTTTTQIGPVVDGDTTTETNQTVTSGSSDNTATTNQFVIDSSNGLLRLRGTWVEKGGVVSSVDASAVANLFTVDITGGGGGGGGPAPAPPTGGG